ncbi:MAG TPA: sulfotransferase domain-containing protein, partial [Acidimicrobiales bacterium]|nr:sulfotransferase domain-containing protein [Acidimicrobiales bacterium]
SHYEHMRQRGLEPLSFEDAVAAEPERLAGEVERMQADPGYQSRAHRIWSYVSRGRYAPQVSAWLKTFPREQLLVLRSEDLFADPAAAFRTVQEFAGLEPITLPAFPAYTRRRPGPPMRDDTRASLRDPVERAFSHYEHMRQRGLEPLSFEDAVAAEPERLAGEVERMQADPGYRSRAHRIWSYVSRGRYASQLSEWLAHFPRQQLLVLRSEDLFADPAAAYARVQAFAGIRPITLPEFPAYTRRQPGPPMRDDTRSSLRDLYRSDIERLTAIVGMPMGWHD